MEILLSYLREVTTIRKEASFEKAWTRAEEGFPIDRCAFAPDDVQDASMFEVHARLKELKYDFEFPSSRIGLFMVCSKIGFGQCALNLNPLRVEEKVLAVDALVKEELVGDAVALAEGIPLPPFVFGPFLSSCIRRGFENLYGRPIIEYWRQRPKTAHSELSMCVLRACAEISESEFEGQWNDICAIAWEAHENAENMKWLRDEDSHDATLFLVRCLTAQRLYSPARQCAGLELTQNIADLLVALCPRNCFDARELLFSMKDSKLPTASRLIQILLDAGEEVDGDFELTREQKMMLAKTRICKRIGLLSGAKKMLEEFPALRTNWEVARIMADYYAENEDFTHTLKWLQCAQWNEDSDIRCRLKCRRSEKWTVVLEYKKRLEELNALDAQSRDILIIISAREGLIEEMKSLKTENPVAELKCLEMAVKNGTEREMVVAALNHFAAPLKQELEKKEQSEERMRMEEVLWSKMKEMNVNLALKQRAGQGKTYPSQPPASNQYH